MYVAIDYYVYMYVYDMFIVVYNICRYKITLVYHVLNHNGHNGIIVDLKYVYNMSIICLFTVCL